MEVSLLVKTEGKRVEHRREVNYFELMHPAPQIAPLIFKAKTTQLL